MSKTPDDNIYTRKDYENYARMMLKTDVFYRSNFPEGLYPKVVGVKSG